MGTLVADVHTFRGVPAVDASNEHGRETGEALHSFSGAAGDDYGAQSMNISCLLIRLNSVHASVYLSGLVTTQLETLDCPRSVANLTWHEPVLWMLKSRA